MLKVLAISGKKGSGKDTLAAKVRQAISQKNKDVHILQVNFADELKKEVSKVTGIPLSTIETLKRSKSSSMRQLLQSYGSVMRELEADHWVQRYSRRVPHDTLISTLILTTDLRYKNELDYLKTLDLTHVHVFRDLKDDDPHSSEDVYWLSAHAHYQYYNVTLDAMDVYAKSLAEKLLR